MMRGMGMSAIRVSFQFMESMKLMAMTATGGEAKALIQDGQVLVNGEVCTMRGKKLRTGDKVEFQGRVICVKTEE